jgi:hypothetical protein
MRPVAEGNLDNMQNYVGARFHVKSKIAESLPPPLPAVRI